MIKKTTISLLTIFFALNTAVVLAAGSNPNGMAPDNQPETTPPSNNATTGTREAVMGNDADTNTTTTQTITTQSETTNTNTTQKQQSDALKRKGMVCTKAKEHHLLATYDDNQNCIVKTCVAGYEVSDNKCIKKTNKDNNNTSPSSQNGTNSTDEYESAKETEQSKANRLLTSLSTAATGIGGMELAQGLSEQKADRAAEQSMSAYIATMRCSYGNGKQVKAGMEEIELPGGNDGNIMKYRAEYVTLAADLKERKTALGLKPGIESEEILDKSQMGLYDDENIGISDGAYASLYRAQMLGSEKDQEQIDAAKQTSKNRVIGGAVAAGVGVVGGIIGDELINQSLSSSTKTAQTCTESGGTWQGGRCHCPDGFIQHTKTGPCFEEKPTEVQTTTNQQTSVESSNPIPQGQNNNSSNSNSSSNNSYGNGDNDDNDEPNFDFEFGDITEPDEEVEPLPEAVITYEKQQNCQKSNGQWTNDTCVCQDSQYTPDESGKCVYVFGSINQPTVIPGPPNDTTGVNSDGSQTNSSVTPTNVAAQTNPNIDASQQTDTPTCGVVGKKECNSNYYVCASDSDCTSDKLPANATAGHCWKSGSRSVCTATACKDGFEPKSGYCQKRAIADRNTDSQKSNTQTAQRPNNTNQKKSNTTNSDGSAKTGAPIQNKVAPTYSQEDVISPGFFTDRKSCLDSVNRVFEKGIGATCVQNQENGKWDVVYTLHDGDPCTCPTGKGHEHDKTCKYGKFGSPHGSNPFVSFTCWAVTCDDGYHISDHICVEDQ